MKSKWLFKQYVFIWFNQLVTIIYINWCIYWQKWLTSRDLFFLHFIFPLNNLPLTRENSAIRGSYFGTTSYVNHVKIVVYLKFKYVKFLEQMLQFVSYYMFSNMLYIFQKIFWEIFHFWRYIFITLFFLADW